MSAILLIDDLRNFRDPSITAQTTIARTSAQALTFLEESNDWDEIWFDHDLGELTDGRVDSTMVIVDYLCEKAFNDEPVNAGIIYIHTSNPVGAQNIATSLNRYGYRTVRVAPEPIFIVE